MKLSRSIERQLQRIEAGIVQREEVAMPRVSSHLATNVAAYEQCIENYLGAIETLLDAMPEPYQRLALEGLERLGYDKTCASRDGSRWAGEAADFLALAVCMVAGRCTPLHMDSSKVTGPLAFPVALCQWVGEHDEELRGTLEEARMIWGFNSHNCEDCGFWVPSGRSGGYYKSRDAHAQGLRYAPGMPFLRCPVCDGATGWQAYAIKHAVPGGFGSYHQPYGEATST